MEVVENKITNVGTTDSHHQMNLIQQRLANTIGRAANVYQGGITLKVIKNLLLIA
jgi:hypothetical protein